MVSGLEVMEITEIWEKLGPECGIKVDINSIFMSENTR
jgi:hypothetical protein